MLGTCLTEQLEAIKIFLKTTSRLERGEIKSKNHCF